MKKITAIFLLIFISVFLTGCSQVNDLLNPPEVNEEVSEEIINKQLEDRAKELADKYSNIVNDDSINPETSTGRRFYITISSTGISTTETTVISQGDTIEWANNSGVKQTVTLTLAANNNITQELDVNKGFAHQFDEVGTYQYKIDPVGASSNITVDARVQSTTTPTTAP